MKDVPYKGMTDVQVVRSLIDGILPAPPDDLTQQSLLDRCLWSLCQDCWMMDSLMRPTATGAQIRVNQMMPPVSPKNQSLKGFISRKL